MAFRAVALKEYRDLEGYSPLQWAVSILLAEYDSNSFKLQDRSLAHLTHSVLLTRPKASSRQT